MNNSQNTLTYVKYAIAGTFEIGVFVLMALGKLTIEQGMSYATAGIVALLAALGLSAGGSAIARGLSGPAPAPQDPDKTAPPRGFSQLSAVLALTALGLCALLLTGCLSSAPLVPVTSANQAQITSCQNTATVHNDVVIGGFVLSGSTVGLAGVAAAEPDSNASAKTTLGVAGAIVGGIAIVDAAVAEMSNSNFQNSQCGAIVGPLPTAKNPGQ